MTYCNWNDVFQWTVLDSKRIGNWNHSDCPQKNWVGCSHWFRNLTRDQLTWCIWVPVHHQGSVAPILPIRSPRSITEFGFILCLLSDRYNRCYLKRAVYWSRKRSKKSGINIKHILVPGLSFESGCSSNFLNWRRLLADRLCKELDCFLCSLRSTWFI